MAGREQMIEEAAKAIMDASWRGLGGRPFSEVYAEIALAVFEQSSTPTDQDEREALLNDLVIHLNNEAYGKDDKTWGNVMRQVEGVEMARAALRTTAERPNPPADWRERTHKWRGRAVDAESKLARIAEPIENAIGQIEEWEWIPERGDILAELNRACAILNDDKHAHPQIRPLEIVESAERQASR